VPHRGRVARLRSADGAGQVDEGHPGLIVPERIQSHRY
jgi:hypothetical protein